MSKKAKLPKDDALKFNETIEKIISKIDKKKKR